MSNDYSSVDRVPIEYILYGQFIKYNKLEEIVNKEFDGSNARFVNIFIDAYQMLLPVYKFYKVDSELSVTSCLINMAIHYRSFFKRYGVESNVFILYSPTMSTNNRRFCGEYNSTYIKRMMNNNAVYQIVNNNLSLMGTIIPYIPYIYFKIGTVETTVMAYDIISKFRDDIPSIFITSSQYAFQLPALCPNTVLFFRKKNRDEDLSYSVNSRDCLLKYIIETRNQDIDKVNIDQRWVNGFMTLSGIPKRDIKSLCTYKESLKILGIISSGYNVIEPEILYDVVFKSTTRNIDYSTILNRFNCIDLSYQYKMYLELPESKETSYLNKYVDMNALNEINDKYFRYNPIGLDRL